MPSKDKSIQKAWRQANKDYLYQYRRKWSFKRYYGMTEEDFDLLYEQQNGQCAICQVKLEKFKAPRDKTAFVDHCHTTNKVRGILCNECNRGLGEFKDNVDILNRAIDYLRKSNAS